MTRTDSEPAVARGLLALGFLALAGATIAAHRSPASGYEVSLYTATPWTVWVALAVALIVSLVVSLEATVARTRRLALCLGGGSILVFVGLPILRGYRFISGGDALTHLGWARGIESGAFHPADLRYPGLHTGSTMVSAAVGVDLAHAMMLFIVLLFGLFVLFVSLSTSLVLDRPYAATVGAFSAFLLLPITNLSTSVTAHAMSQAILFSAVAVFLVLAYVRGDDRSAGSAPVGWLLAIVLAATVLYHPQLAAHLLAVLVGICVVQLCYRRYRVTHPVATHRPIYAQTAVLAAAFAVWAANHDLIRDVFTFHLASTVEFFLGDGGSAGDSVDAQGDSLAEIGGSVLEIVLKMLGPHLVLGGVVALCLAWLFLGNGARLDRATDGVLHYFAVGLVALTGLFGVYFFGSSGEMYFRVFGFIMLFVTIAGAVAVAYGVNAFSRPRVAPLHGAVAVGFAIMIVVSSLALFPSPYVYNPSPHVSEQTMSGYDLALETAADDVHFDGIRAGPNRYADARNAELDRTRVHGSIEGEAIEDGIVGQYENERYISVDRQDRDREVIAYKELRYSEAQFTSIETQVGVDRVQSNGELEVYYVAG